MIPLPVTTTIATTGTTDSAHNSTDMTSDRPKPEIELNTSASTPRSRTSTLRHAVERPAVTSSAARDPDRMTSREAKDNDLVMVVIAAVVAGCCLVVLLVLILVVLVVRRHRHSGKYDPSRPHTADDHCRGLCVPCCPLADGQGSSEDPDFDASTVRLKLNTSASSATSTAGRSFVSDRPVGLTNGVTTLNDPVQQTLIGPPVTNVQRR